MARARVLGSLKFNTLLDIASSEVLFTVIAGELAPASPVPAVIVQFRI
jgi:hypothetical protein